MKQISFAQAEHQNKKKVTRRERFLAQMNALVPWQRLIDALSPSYFPNSAGKRGRPPIGLERMLRIYFLQQFSERLAEHLKHSHQVKIIEHSLERCTQLSERLDRTVVMHGSATSKRLLEEENIEDCDIFCALTNDDEVNIMSSLLAKRLGAKKVLTLINNVAYVDLVQGGEIDIAISPQQATIGSLLTHVRRGDIVNVHSLRRGAAEAIEAIAHGDKQSSKVVGRAIGEIDLPESTTIGAIVRGKEVLIAHDDVVVESGDHVILFVIDKRRIREVERLFQVGLTFF